MNVDVAVCIVRNADGCVLVAERTARQVSAGYWELPGGKVDAGETPSRAAARELFEEVGLDARTMRPALAYAYDFKGKRVRLNFFFIDDWHGSPHGREGQRIAWIDPASPNVGPILPSNARMFAVLAMPSRYVRARSEADGRSPGTRLMRVDEPTLAPDQRVALVRRIRASAAIGAQIFVVGSAQEVHRAGASGMHSSAHDLRRRLERPAVPLWSVSCRDGDDVSRAISLGADLAIVPPGYARAASPAAIPLYEEDDTGSAFRIDPR